MGAEINCRSVVSRADDYALSDIASVVRPYLQDAHAYQGMAIISQIMLAVLRPETFEVLNQRQLELLELAHGGTYRQSARRNTDGIGADVFWHQAAQTERANRSRSIAEQVDAELDAYPVH